MLLIFFSMFRNRFLFDSLSSIFLSSYLFSQIDFLSITSTNYFFYQLLLLPITSFTNYFYQLLFVVITSSANTSSTDYFYQLLFYELLLLPINLLTYNFNNQFTYQFCIQLTYQYLFGTKCSRPIVSNCNFSTAHLFKLIEIK